MLWRDVKIGSFLCPITFVSTCINPGFINRWLCYLGSEAPSLSLGLWKTFLFAPTKLPIRTRQACSPPFHLQNHMYSILLVGQTIRNTWEYRGQLVCPKNGSMGAYFFGTSIPFMKILVDLDRDLQQYFECFFIVDFFRGCRYC